MAGLGLAGNGMVETLIESLIADGYLLRESGSRSRNLRLTDKGWREVSQLPVVGRIAAGKPMFAEDDVQEYVDLPPSWEGLGDFGLVVEGDSMMPKFDPGDVAVIRRQSVAERGQIVAVELFGRGEEGAIIKGFFTEPDRIVFRSVNERFEDIVVTTPEEFQIIGVVMGVLRRGPQFMNNGSS